MKNTIAVFQISSEEDLRFQLDFVGLALTGRTLKVSVRERASNALKIDLTAPSNLTLAGAGNLTVFYPRASMTGWAKAIEYEADIIDETGGSATRIMAVRFIYDHPGNLVYGVKGNQASVAWGNNQAVVTAIGGVGPPGPANVITIGDVDTLETGELATASLTGDAPTQVLNLGLPKGDTGTAATIAVGTVDTVAPGEPAAVTNVGTSGAAVFDFEIPAGAAATIAAGDVTTIAAGEPAAVTNSGTTSAAVFDFDIPAGAAATIEVGTVTASLPGSPAVVTNVGTDTAAVFDFEIPRGDQGPPGSVVDGDKGDVTVSGGGTVWTIDSNAVTFPKMQEIATERFLGRMTAGPGLIELLTKAQAQGALDITAALVALGALATAADKLPYATGTDTFAMADFSAWARTLLDDASANAALQTLGAPWELVSQAMVSGSPGSVEFTGLSGALEHRLLVSGVRPATDDAALILQIQTGGSAWQSSGYVYVGRIQGPGGGADINSTSDAYSAGIILSRAGSGQGVGNASGEGASAEVTFVPEDSAHRRRFRSVLDYTRSDGVECLVSVAGAYGTNAAITGVRLIWASGNFANVGKVALLRRVS